MAKKTNQPSRPKKTVEVQIRHLVIIVSLFVGFLVAIIYYKEAGQYEIDRLKIQRMQAKGDFSPLLQQLSQAYMEESQWDGPSKKRIVPHMCEKTYTYCLDTCEDQRKLSQCVKCWEHFKGCLAEYRSRQNSQALSKN